MSISLFVGIDKNLVKKTNFINVPFSADTPISSEAHVKRSIVVRTVETRDGEVRMEGTSKPKSLALCYQGFILE